MKQGQGALHIAKPMTATVTPLTVIRKLGKFKMRVFLQRASISKKIYIIKDSRIVYCWMANLMLITFLQKSYGPKKYSFLSIKRYLKGSETTLIYI